MRARLLIIMSVAVALVGGIVAAVATRPGSRGADDAGRHVRAADGVRLRVSVTRPSGPGRFPLVVMPASWGAGAGQYTAVAARLSEAGYVVVSYAQRGFEGSGGKIDFAGPATQRDLSSVVTWALEHTPADPARIGAVGISYGAGVSLLGAAHDSRIRAVVALSGWGDLATALAPGGVLNVQAFYALLRTRGVAKRADADVKAIGAALLANDPASATAVLTRMSPARSPIRSVAQLNRNRTAVMLANAYQDSIFSPASLVPFFAQLTGPKRLQLEAGDHGGPERAGLQGKQTKVWTDALAWLDAHVKGRPGAIASAPAVQLRDARTGAWHGYASWAAVGRATSLSLGSPADAAAAITTSAQPAWRAGITGGTDTAADVGPAQFGSVRPYVPPVAQTAAISTGVALRWSSPPSPVAALLSGSMTLQVTATSSAPRAAVFTYLYDVDAAGTGTLVAMQPSLLTAAGTSLRVQLPPVSWTLPAGHHLSVVVDTVDPRYEAATARGTLLTFSSSASAPATLTVALG